MSEPPSNTFLDAPLGAAYFRTALPIIFVMGMNGLLAVADALFLGHYVGPQALAAVTLMFPIYMLIVAFSTLVANGMSSLLARHLGGDCLAEARGVFAGAHGLALLSGGILIVAYAVLGRPVSYLAAGGSDELARMGLTYLRITVLFSPLMFVLSVNSDALRNEGRVGLMASVSFLVTLANILFNYLLIAQLDMGVAGSAYGTALAQALALVIMIVFRGWGATELRFSALLNNRLTHSWGRILALGAPQSLSFVGLALVSGAIMAALQIINSPTYATTVSAYGIITRVLTFTFLPLLGLSFAMQTITGNNFGARQWQRSNKSLLIALGVAMAYGAIVQLTLTVYAAAIGGAFVTDPAVVAEVARILPLMVLMMFIAGPLMITASYFQAIGDAGRAALLGISKPYLFAIPLIFILSFSLGETGVWISGPVAELMLLLLTFGVLVQTAGRRAMRWGLFVTAMEGTS